MGTLVIRGTDQTALGGIITSVGTVFAEGKAVALMGDVVTPHPHGNVTMAGTVQSMGMSVFAGQRAIARQGDMVTPPCAEPFIPTSTSVWVA